MNEPRPFAPYRASRLLNNDVALPKHDRREREKDAESANSSAICATEDELSLRLACFGGRDFVVQQPQRISIR